ncbi:serine/threonine-protein kinase [Bifidobacterium moukalabense]|jgi:eukaryotic-like serine/threonine-protein kinase|uniref:non-specific serine/threonine protein kinase n=1 Tax=Bifidobacterium moukalabense DSM 27321 TaxID=1435051 RepID=W4NBS9_9BIFI|nr:serine/threonine-protein kinase [Bifidobacterium moukalabense]ETY71921.1 kinase [Bifidobacterium moukalabense DSM 27321]
MEAPQPVPPQITGYDFVQRLGAGSEATVYLYQQRSPARPVAIKVSNKSLDPRAAARFRAEADFMAQISSHPYILSIFESGVTSTGLGYTVFEFAPGGSYRDALRSATLNADQMLDLGIDLASALFAAHRKGIIHRDIKTSNVLINAQGMPVLSDFGISATIYDHRTTGYSLPWAPPEVISGTGGGNEASDIYSLGATLFATITGRSPYEYAYRVSNKQELATAIVNRPLPKLNRPDVPPQVEQVLRKALDKNPDQRYYSALDFARAMQRVQYALYGHATPTTVEGVPQYPKDLSSHPDAHAADDLPDSGQSKAWAKPVVIGTLVVAAIAVVAMVFAFIVIPHMDSISDGGNVHVTDPTTKAKDDDTDDNDDIDTAIVPSVENLTGQYNGDKVRFAWVNPDPKKGDSYAWSIVGDSGVDMSTQATATDDTQVEVPAGDGPQTCIQVSLIRADRRMSQNPTIACAAKP